eukprot:TRINITY_DN3312_c0_g1_i1.p2 TRINITY_DN3312_c0_g1~~TRINITY_DN3312_c0_g1_i1.p2  ORF type:complete len:145 (+),score=11.28 TRINITY_DN3312_c0_g1_i1:332-766(+)
MYPVQGEAAAKAYPGDYPPTMGYPGGSNPGAPTFNSTSAPTPPVGVPFHHAPDQQAYYQPDVAVPVQGFAIQQSSVVQQPPEDTGMLACSIIGLIFSFIPIIGWITFCVNWPAPPGSKRRIFGIVAGVIGTIFFVISLISLIAR